MSALPMQKNRLENLLQQQTAAQAEVEKPFPQEEELAQKSVRLAELNAQLDVDENITSRRWKKRRMRNCAPFRAGRPERKVG